MVMRILVGIVGLVIGLAGLTEIVAPRWTVLQAAGLYHIVPLVIAGIVALAMGIVLVVAAIKRQVGLRVFVLVFGGIVIAVSLIAIAEPGLLRNWGYAMLLQHSWGFQLVVLWITGLVRIALGGLLIYASAKPPRSVPSEH